MIGRKLRLLIAHKGINQRQLAEILGVSQVIVSEWVKNKKMPSVIIFKKIAEYFNTSIDLLLEEMDLEQDPVKTVKDLTKKNIEEDLYKAIGSLPEEFKKDLLNVAEKLNERVQAIRSFL